MEHPIAGGWTPFETLSAVLDFVGVAGAPSAARLVLYQLIIGNYFFWPKFGIFKTKRQLFVKEY